MSYWEHFKINLEIVSLRLRSLFHSLARLTAAALTLFGAIVILQPAVYAAPYSTILQTIGIFTLVTELTIFDGVISIAVGLIVFKLFG